jgi:hypothetical protein
MIPALKAILPKARAIYEQKCNLLPIDDTAWHALRMEASVRRKLYMVANGRVEGQTDIVIDSDKETVNADGE